MSSNIEDNNVFELTILTTIDCDIFEIWQSKTIDNNVSIEDLL